MSPDLSVVDLFCGVGGLSLGAARAGFSLRGAVETDSRTIETHKLNFPSTVHINVSVTALSGKKIINLIKLNNNLLTGIIGGPPCQGFSNIGKKNPDDPRNELFSEFFRIVAESRPKFFLAENVPGIIRNGNSDICDNAFSYIEEKYEFLPPISINASNYGAPTTRTRLFFFGYLEDAFNTLTINDFKPPSDIKRVFVKDALEGLPEKINPEWQEESQCWQIVGNYNNSYYSRRLRGHVPIRVGNKSAITRLKKEKLVSGCLGTIHTKEVVKRFEQIKPGKKEPVSKTVRLDPNGFCPTLRAGTDSDHGSHQALRPIHPTENRVITPREAARLQGFPDWFQFHPTKWHSFRQIGNSVSPIVAERIFNVIKKAIK